MVDRLESKNHHAIYVESREVESEADVFDAIVPQTEE